MGPVELASVAFLWAARQIEFWQFVSMRASIYLLIIQVLFIPPFEYIDAISVVIETLIPRVPQVNHRTGGVDRVGKGGWSKG